MTIEDEIAATDELLHDSRFHLSALGSDPDAAGLSAPVEEAERTLREKRDAREEKEDAVARARAAVRQAEADATRAFGAEKLARAELAAQLRRNEGGLRLLYPRQPARVRGYFRSNPGPAHEFARDPAIGDNAARP